MIRTANGQWIALAGYQPETPEKMGDTAASSTSGAASIRVLVGGQVFSRQCRMMSGDAPRAC